MKTYKTPLPNYSAISINHGLPNNRLPPGKSLDGWWTSLRSGLWRLRFRLSSGGRKRYAELTTLLRDAKADVLGERDSDAWYLVYLGTKPCGRRRGRAGKLLEDVIRRVSLVYFYPWAYPTRSLSLRFLRTPLACLLPFFIYRRTQRNTKNHEKPNLTHQERPTPKTGQYTSNPARRLITTTTSGLASASGKMSSSDVARVMPSGCRSWSGSRDTSVRGLMLLQSRSEGTLSRSRW